MNIATMYKNDNKEISDIVKNIINYCLENKEIITNENKKIKELKFINKITSRCKYNLFLIFSNDINEIKEFLNMNKNKEKVIIFTSNLKTEHILNCIEITSDICYMNNNLSVILNKINKSLNKTTLEKNQIKLNQIK